MRGGSFDNHYANTQQSIIFLSFCREDDSFFSGLILKGFDDGAALWLWRLNEPQIVRCPMKVYVAAKADGRELH